MRGSRRIAACLVVPEQLGALHGILDGWGATAYLAKISDIFEGRLEFHISQQNCSHVPWPASYFRLHMYVLKVITDVELV